ncbi:MAG: hypothetical protein R2716_00785 [Microthrixaceae bacterium]
MDRELGAAGAVDGSTVVIGDFSFEYRSDDTFEGSGGRRTRRQRRGAAVTSARRLVVKVGTSSLTDEGGRIDDSAVAAVAAELAEVTQEGHEVLLVSSGAIAAGLPALGWDAGSRPRDPRTLQAVSAVGQAHLLDAWNSRVRRRTASSQDRSCWPRSTSDAEPSTCRPAPPSRGCWARRRAGHQRERRDRGRRDPPRRRPDHNAGGHLVGAELLVLLTDTPGLMDADPRLRSDAALVEEIAEIDRELSALPQVPAPAAQRRGWPRSWPPRRWLRGRASVA